MTDTVPARRSSQRRTAPYLWMLGVLWLLPILLVILGYLVLDKDVPPGACEGIGFGCQLSPADGLLLVAVVYGVPVLFPAGLIGVLVIAIVQSRRGRGVTSPGGAR
jgi:hypothetical protein